MKTWYVTIKIETTEEVEAENQEEAKRKATDNFDPTAHDCEIVEAWTKDEAEEDPCTKGHEGFSWWEFDAQGIPLCRVCDRCETFRLAGYRPEILSGYTQADVDEPIDE